MKILDPGLTYDDIFLIPGYSEVLPKNTNIESRLTRNISLKLPLVSAPMDTVTEYALAIALAQEGGIGIIHKNMSIKRQAEEVAKVKRFVSGLIVKPITLSPENTIRDAMNVREKYRISGIPITENRKLVGILCNRDIRFVENINDKVKEYMTTNLVTAELGITLEESKKLLHKNRIEKLPVVDEKNQLLGLITIRDINKVEEFPNAAKDKEGHLLVGAAVGAGADVLERVDALAQAGADVLVVDTAHGHSKGVIDVVRTIKHTTSIDVIAGNIATAEAAQALIDAGADAVKVGIGPGSICTTRIVAGIGVPQVTAIMNVASVAAKAGVPVIADGGIKFSGDITKAIAAGGSTVMLGSLFAGTDESPGEKIIFRGRSYKEYRGMGSIGAMAQSQGSSDRYFQSHEADSLKLVPEGVEARIPYKGSLSQVVHQLVGGLRAGMGYCGAKDIISLQKNAKAVQITSAGLRESHVHDVTVTKETPNYKLDAND